MIRFEHAESVKTSLFLNSSHGVPSSVNDVSKYSKFRLHPTNSPDRLDERWRSPE
jgi:hypothetical protein